LLLLLLRRRRSIVSSALPLSSHVQGCLLLAATQPPLPLLCSAASSTLPLLRPGLQALLMWGAAAPAKGLRLAAAQALALSGAGGVMGAGGPLLSLLRLMFTGIFASRSVTNGPWSGRRLLQLMPMPRSTSREDIALLGTLVWMAGSV
jgi:hypothetical protein